MFESIIEKMNIKDDENYSCLNKQFFIYNEKNKDFFTYDFILKQNKKVIEFNGDYWHCNPKKYKFDFFNKRKQMTAQEIWDRDKLRIDSIKSEGYEVLVIWESDYNKNKEKIIEKCLNFLKNQC